MFAWQETSPCPTNCMLKEAKQSGFQRIKESTWLELAQFPKSTLRICEEHFSACVCQTTALIRLAKEWQIQFESPEPGLVLGAKFQHNFVLGEGFYFFLVLGWRYLG